MAEIGYPLFEGGMTLTKDDLNTLREFFDVQDTVLGRLIGFGIACGLEVERMGTSVVVSPGLAVDQLGRGLLLDADATVPGSPLSSERFSFIEAAPGGVTPVLVLRENDQAAPECAEDCEAHAPLRLRSVEVVLVAGRLRSSFAKFATEKLLEVDILTVGTNGAVVGDMAAVKKAITDRLAEERITLSTAAAAKLAAIVPSTTTALNHYRAAFLNEVLFATIELIRCRTLHEGTCLRDETTPGVALGWYAPNNTFDCRYAHHFAPNQGLVSALIGGDCGDPCDLALDELETLLIGYYEPAATPPSGGGGTRPPKGGGFEICPPKGRYGSYVFDACRLKLLPEERFDKNILDKYWREKPLIPRPGDPRPEEILPLDDFEGWGVGTLGLGPSFGDDVERAKERITNVLKDYVSEPDIRVMTPEQVAVTDGFEHQVSAGVGDTIVLVKDASDVVVGTGRISAQHTVRNVGVAVQTANAVANDAAHAVETLNANVATTVATQLAGVQAQVRAQVEADFSSQLTALRADLTREFTAEIGKLSAIREGADVGVLRADLIELQSKYERQTATIDALTRQQTETTRRVDAVMTRQPIVATAPVVAQPLVAEAPVAEVRTEELLGVIGSIKEAVTLAATKRQAPAVEAKLAETEEAVRALETSGGDTPVRMTTTQREALLGVFTGLTDAAEKAGAPAENLEAVRLNLDALKGMPQ